MQIHKKQSLNELNLFKTFYEQSVEKTENLAKKHFFNESKKKTFFYQFYAANVKNYIVFDLRNKFGSNPVKTTDFIEK